MANTYLNTQGTQITPTPMTVKEVEARSIVPNFLNAVAPTQNYSYKSDGIPTSNGTTPTVENEAANEKINSQTDLTDNQQDPSTKLNPTPFSVDSLTSLVIDSLQHTENSKSWIKGGYDPTTKSWRPHNSAEGGNQTVAWGIKLDPNNPLIKDVYDEIQQNGAVSDEKINELMPKVVGGYIDAAKKAYSEMGYNNWDQLPDYIQAILVDYQYNTGDLKKFPSMVKALSELDIDSVINNNLYLRHYKDAEGKVHPLQQRNDYTLKALQEARQLIADGITHKSVNQPTSSQNAQTPVGSNGVQTPEGTTQYIPFEVKKSDPQEDWSQIMSAASYALPEYLDRFKIEDPQERQDVAAAMTEISQGILDGKITWIPGGAIQGYDNNSQAAKIAISVIQGMKGAYDRKKAKEHEFELASVNYANRLQMERQVAADKARLEQEALENKQRQALIDESRRGAGTVIGTETGTETPTPEQPATTEVTKGEEKPIKDEWTSQDSAHVAGILADLGSIITAPAAPVSFGLGALGTLSHAYADFTDKDVSFTEALGRTGLNAGLTLLGAIPGGSIAKMGKVAKFLVTALPKAVGSIAVINLLANHEEIGQSFKSGFTKIKEGNYRQITRDEWHAIGTVLATAAGITRGAFKASATKRIQGMKVKDGSGKEITLTAEDVSKISGAGLKGWFTGGEAKNTAALTELNNILKGYGAKEVKALPEEINFHWWNNPAQAKAAKVAKGVLAPGQDYVGGVKEKARNVFAPSENNLHSLKTDYSREIYGKVSTNEHELKSWETPTSTPKEKTKSTRTRKKKEESEATPTPTPEPKPTPTPEPKSTPKIEFSITPKFFERPYQINPKLETPKSTVPSTVKTGNLTGTTNANTPKAEIPWIIERPALPMGAPKRGEVIPVTVTQVPNRTPMGQIGSNARLLPPTTSMPAKGQKTEDMVQLPDGSYSLKELVGSYKQASTPRAATSRGRNTKTNRSTNSSNSGRKTTSTKSNKSKTTSTKTSNRSTKNTTGTKTSSRGNKSTSSRASNKTNKENKSTRKGQSGLKFDWMYKYQDPNPNSNLHNTYLTYNDAWADQSPESHRAKVALDMAAGKYDPSKISTSLNYKVPTYQELIAQKAVSPAPNGKINIVNGEVVPIWKETFGYGNINTPKRIFNTVIQPSTAIKAESDILETLTGAIKPNLVDAPQKNYTKVGFAPQAEATRSSLTQLHQQVNNIDDAATRQVAATNAAAKEVELNNTLSAQEGQFEDKQRTAAQTVEDANAEARIKAANINQEQVNNAKANMAEHLAEYKARVWNINDTAGKAAVDAFEGEARDRREAEMARGLAALYDSKPVKEAQDAILRYTWEQMEEEQRLQHKIAEINSNLRYDDTQKATLIDAAKRVSAERMNEIKARANTAKLLYGQMMSLATQYMQSHNQDYNTHYSVFSPHMINTKSSADNLLNAYGLSTEIFKDGGTLNKYKALMK